MEREERKEIMKKARFSASFTAHFDAAAATAADFIPREKKKSRKNPNLELITGSGSSSSSSSKFGSGLEWHSMESEDSEPLNKRKYSDLFKEQSRWLER